MIVIMMVLFALLGVVLVYNLYQMISLDLKARNVPHAKGLTLLSTFGGQRGEGLLLYFFLRKKYQSEVPLAVQEKINDYRNKILIIFGLIFCVFAVLAYLIMTTG